MKDSVLLHRKAKKRTGESIPEAREAWNRAVEIARQAGRGDLVVKHQPDNGAGWYTIYAAIRKIQKELERE